MEIIKELLPYVFSIFSGIGSYIMANRNFKNEVEAIKINNEHEIKKLMEQHKVDIDNLKEKHKLEMDAKERDYQHEKEILELKSKNSINEKNQEMMNSAMSGVVGGFMKDIIDGKITAEDINKLAKQFPNNENSN